MTTNGYFGPGLFRFLRDLRPHNKRSWFEASKQRYKADVQAPFLRLVTDLAPALKEIGGGFIADPSPMAALLCVSIETNGFRKTRALTRRTPRRTSGTRMAKTGQFRHISFIWNQATP